MEERAGFEPADGKTVTGFQDRLFQPLRHLSIADLILSYFVLLASLTNEYYYSTSLLI